MATNSQPRNSYLEWMHGRAASSQIRLESPDPGAAMGPPFEWDDSKAHSNQQKHGVSFPEAAGVFADPLAALFPDPDHSDDELREIIVGYSAAGRRLVVSFTERGDAIRIISARPATPRERSKHENPP